MRDRLFTVRDVMQSNVREKLQERSVRVTHNLSVIGGGGLLLSIIVGLFGINVDGIPGSSDEPHAFAMIFSFCLFLLGAITIAIGMHRLGLKPAPPEEGVSSRKVRGAARDRQNVPEGGRGARESPPCFLRQFTAELRSQLPTQSRRSLRPLGRYSLIPSFPSFLRASRCCHRVSCRKSYLSPPHVHFALVYCFIEVPAISHFQCNNMKLFVVSCCLILQLRLRNFTVN